MPRPAGLPKTGGRQAGTPNRSTREVKNFLQGVFGELFKDPAFKTDLVIRLRNFELDPRTFQTLLAYAYGSPARQVEHKHSGTVSLARIIAGAVDDEHDDEDEELEEAVASNGAERP